MVYWMEKKFYKSESESGEKVFLILSLMPHLGKIISLFYSFTFVCSMLEITNSSYEYLDCKGLI